MSNKSRQKVQEAAQTPAKEDGKVSPEEATVTGNQTTAVEPEGAGDAGDLAASGVSKDEELEKLVDTDQQAAIAGSMGGSDNYPYQDRTAIPLHERTQLMDSNTEASQAELNPAFTAQAKDGGPTNADNESVGTEPNAYETQLAAAQNAGGDELEAQVQEQQDQASEQQMDVEAVNAAAQEKAPDGVDAATGQKEGEVTPPGAPSGMEPSPDGEEGTAGADSSAQA